MSECPHDITAAHHVCASCGKCIEGGSLLWFGGNAHHYACITGYTKEIEEETP